MDNKSFQRIVHLQYGFFTARQAVSCGIPSNQHYYHVQTGKWIREERGIFRVQAYPLVEGSNLVFWYLWGHDIKGQPQGVVSHDSALACYGLGERGFEPVHITVSPEFRRRRLPEEGVVIHKDSLPLSAIETRGAFMMTTAFRTLRDMEEEVQTAGTWEGMLSTAEERGLLSEAELQVLRGGGVCCFRSRGRADSGRGNLLREDGRAGACDRVSAPCARHPRGPPRRRPGRGLGGGPVRDGDRYLSRRGGSLDRQRQRLRYLLPSGRFRSSARAPGGGGRSLDPPAPDLPLAKNGQAFRLCQRLSVRGSGRRSGSVATLRRSTASSWG
jgi:hypothetical protein